MRITTAALPALSHHSFLRYLTFTVLYIAQGIPEGITYFAIPAWMAMHGKTPGEVGAFVGAIGIPWSLKFLIAPLMDRFTYLPMGRRRLWVLLGQAGLIISFLLLGLVPDPLNNLKWLMAAGVMVGFFGAFQDVATDGMAIDIIPVAEQARANGLMWGAKIMGTSASLFIGTWFINRYGLQQATGVLVILVMLIMLVPLLMRERPGEKLLPWTNGHASTEGMSLQLDSWKEIFTSLFKVFFLPSSIYMGVAFFLFSMCVALLEALLPVLTIQELGWDNTRYSHLFSSTSLAAGFLGIIAGGALADFFGKRRMLSIYLACFAGVMFIMALLRPYWATGYVVSGFIAVYYTLYVFTSIASFAIGMQLCWTRISATQFTLYMAIANVGRSLGAALLGPLKARLSWDYIFIFIALLAACSLFFVFMLRMKKHLGKVDLLEADHLRHMPHF